MSESIRNNIGLVIRKSGSLPPFFAVRVGCAATRTEFKQSQLDWDRHDKKKFLGALNYETDSEREWNGNEQEKTCIWTLSLDESSAILSFLDKFKLCFNVF